MKHLQLSPKFLIVILFFLLLLPSCNNEELFVVEQAAIVEDIDPEQQEETEEEEEDPNTEDVAPAIDAVDDTVITMQHAPVDIEVHLNDINLPESIALSNTNPLNGVLSINDNETPDNLIDDTVVYTPNPGFSGIDNFDYTICDATNADNCDTATVTITVEPREVDIASELKAFPSAYGAGAYTTGGRGGTVYHVTNLNSSGSGSLADALSQSNRTVVFDVSGVINVDSSLVGGIGCASNITIAGQTAPEGGITIDGNRAYFYNVDNLIVRHIRFKGGNDNTNIAQDSFSATGNITNQIFDHCTFGFGGDESGSWYANRTEYSINNVTVQRCLFTESSKGTIIGGGEDLGNFTGEISVLNNMWYNSSYRYPNATGDGGIFEIINNVCWTSRGRASQINGENVIGNYINNYLDFGVYKLKDRSTNLSHYYTSNYPQLYVSGNKFVAQNTYTSSESNPLNVLTATVAQMNADNKLQWGYRNSGEVNDGNRLPADYFTDIQHPLLGNPVPIQTADQALADVSTNVGCNARLNADGSVSDNTDTLDANSLAQVVLGNYVTGMSSTNYNVPAITSVTRPAGYDTDGDGMADIWERATYGDLNSTATGDADGDGYTNIEEFINLVDKE